jgi:NADH-quinone oxidoreductase subunit L
MVNPWLLLLVPLLPAFGAAINGFRAFWWPKTPKNRAITNAIAIGSTALSALLAAYSVLSYVRGGTEHAFQHVYYSWIPAGIGQVTGGFISNFGIDFAFRLDPLSCTMLLIVTWVGCLIHIYATGYMSHDSGYTRFFTYLNLFMFMMLLLVLGANYMVMFVGWEGVGLCSYLLIGFYYDKNFAAEAGKKAFIANRVGDFGFILGIFLIFNTFGTSDYGRVFAQITAHGHAYAGVATAICLLLFVGACRTRWPVRRRSPHSSTPRRWSPPASTWSSVRTRSSDSRQRLWRSWRSSARSPRSSPRRSASCRTTSRKSSRTRRSRSSASCSSRPASAPSPRQSSMS